MYNLVFKKQPAKYYKKAPANIKRKLNNIFDALSRGNLQVLDIKHLRGDFEGVIRLRAGDLRIFVEFASKDTINVLTITPRGNAY